MRIDRAEHYYRVGLERIEQAWTLYYDQEHESYALAMYVAGVAVECMLRAFKMRNDPTFDEKHDLLRLFKAIGMLDFDSDVLRSSGFNTSQVDAHFQELQVAATVVHRLWSNDYRFASEDRLRAHLKSQQRGRRIRGDFLKKQALDLLNASQKIIEKGVLQWSLSRRSRPS